MTTHAQRFANLQHQLDDALSDMQRDMTLLYAHRFLGVFRDMLKPFNWSRHEVRISAGMGRQNLQVRDLTTGEVRHLHDICASGKVLDELRAIESMMDGGSEWTYHLHGERLTP